MHEAGTRNKNTENQTCHKNTCPKRKAFREASLRRYLILKIIPINTKQLAQNNTEFYFPGKINFQRFKMLLGYVIFFSSPKIRLFNFKPFYFPCPFKHC